MLAQVAGAQSTLGPVLGTLVQEPRPWAYDNGVRREAVLDHDHTPPKLVRHVGWRCCLRCDAPFFSEDVVALRLCDRCKGLTMQKPLGE